MTRVIEWIVSLLIVIAVFVVIGVFLPSKRTVSHSIETNRPMATVNDLMNGFTRFRDWNGFVAHDPRMQLTVSGPVSGVGAKLDFSSSQRSIGSGSWELVESEPGERIVYALNDRRRGHDKKMTLRFERTGQRNQNVKITQRYSVDYGWDLFGRYAGLYVTDGIGDDMKRGLGKLSNLLATIPRFDYSMHAAPFEFVEVPAANVLLATATAKRSNDEIALAMTNQVKWIEQVMEKNELEPAGPLRIITNEFGADTYAFDVVQPIRKKGTGPAVPDEDAAEGEDAAEAAPPAPVVPVDPNAPLPRFDITLEGAGNPVIYAQFPAIRAASTTYVGPSPGLPRVRDLTRAWAIVNGAETIERPYEDYNIAIKDMLSETAEFRVYWPVRTEGVTPGQILQIAPEPVDEDEDAPSPPPGEDGEAGPDVEPVTEPVTE